MWDEERGGYFAAVIDVLTLRGDRIEAVTAFLAPWVFNRFGDIPGNMTPDVFAESACQRNIRLMYDDEVEVSASRSGATTAPSCSTLHGDLDLASADVVRGRLDELRAAGKPALLDIDELDFMDSSGLRLVLDAAETSDKTGWGVLAHARPRAGAAPVRVDRRDRAAADRPAAGRPQRARAGAR